MPDITDHPQFDAVSMMVEERMYQIAQALGCLDEMALSVSARICAKAAVEAMTAVLLHAYDCAHSADKAAP